jgi:hypothetical protein
MLEDKYALETVMEGLILMEGYRKTTRIKI